MSNDVPNDPSSADDNPFQPHRKHGANPDEWLNSAAVYVRMSTEHQQYSTSNQMDVIREYAKKRGQEIVKEYSDDGKSGLNIKGRGSLEQMIRDVLEGKAHYKSILVYDVSRWGRFQDADESAYYEYICKQAGVAVHYCAEQFENDGSPISTIIKGIKRTMAGEYSRELSTKVYQGACRLVKLGFRQGGAAGYGLRRVLVDANGVKKGELKMGEQKSIQTDRVVLVAGPDEEVAIVRRIYHEFVTDGEIGIRDCRWIERARHRDGLRASLEPGDSASSPDERKIHREQCLFPDFVQTEKEAHQQSADRMGASERRFRGHHRTGIIPEGAGNHSGPQPEIYR